MGNSGSFKVGHKETAEHKEKRIISLKKSWKKRSAFHGMYNTKFYTSWRSMTTRCRGTAGADSIRKYKNKGIVVCDKWLSFKGFYEDMYPTYKEGLTIDRIKNELGYFKENCRWATAQQQCDNTSVAIKLTHNGMTLGFHEWSELTGITKAALKLRYHRKYKKGLITIDQLLK